MKHIIPAVWSISISGMEFGQFSQSFLYAWVRGVDVLYIGQSRNGISRLFNHHVIGKQDEVLSSDTFYFMFLPTEELDAQEKSWIKYHQPKYNVRHNPSVVIHHKEHISFAERDRLQEVVLDDDSTPEQVVIAAATLRGERPKFLGKYCAYDCTCPTCNKHRALALR